MEYIINRFKEASTWAGIAIFLGMFGVDGDTITRLTANAPAILTGLAALFAIFAPNVAGNKAKNPVTDHGMKP